MNWQWLYIILSLSPIVRSFECPESVRCSSCQRYPEDVYKMYCATGNEDIIKVEIRPNDYVKLTCHNSANWTEFHLGSSDPIRGIKKLSFEMCNLPEIKRLGSIAKQLLVDKIDILHFSSYMNLSSTLARDSLRGLGSVKKLTIASNNFTNLPDDLLQDLANLTSINIRDNNLRRVPKNFFTTPNLEVIEISTNELDTLDSSTFGKLEHLRLLNMWDNKLVKILPNTFDELVSLETLDLQRNKLETLPHDLFHRLSNLKRINLSQNNFTMDSLSDNLLRNCSNLRSLVLMQNRRNMTTLPNGFFANLTKLTSVELREISLISLPEDLFRGTEILQILSVERNYLSTLPSKIFNDTHELLTLDLNFNNITSLPDDIFAKLKKLIKLDLSRNHLTTISENLLSGLTSLLELNMERNNMIHIHFYALVSLQNLRVARFSYNSLTLNSSLGTLESPFRSSAELEELYLDHNNISQIFVDWMYTMQFIRILNLSYNKLHLLKEEDMQFLSQDLNVDLMHNEIRHINLDTLEIWAVHRSTSQNVIISVEENPIECDCQLYNLLRYLEGRLHPNVQYAFHLKIGQLKCNSPNELQNMAIINSKSTILKCHTNVPGFDIDCPIQCNCQVRPADKTFLMNCSNASLTEAPRKIDSPLDYSVELDLSGNSLTAVPNFDQPGYDKVTILALNHNNISRISTGIIAPNLKVLKLHNNNLSRVEQSVIDLLNNSSQLTELTLESNPWSCDCEAREFLRFMQKKSIAMPDLQKVTCLGEKLPLFQMTPEQLCPSNIDWIIGGCLAVGFFSGIIIVVLGALCYGYQREFKENGGIDHLDPELRAYLRSNTYVT